MIHHVHSITRLQVSLDRCTGAVALKLRAVSITMDQSFARLKAYRAIVISVSLANPLALPEAIQLFRKAAQIERAIQQSARRLWEIEEKRWALDFMRCQMPWGSHASTFPEFPFQIVNPEMSLFDLKQAQWGEPDSHVFRIRIEYGKLRSGAVVERIQNRWAVAWNL